MVSALKVDGPPPARAGPRGHRGRARGPAGDASTASTSSRPAEPGVLAIDVACSARHVHPHRWPPTSAACSAAAPTSATCAAPPSARSRSTRRPPPDDVRAAGADRRPCGTCRVDVDDATRGARRQRPGAAGARPGAGPWAVVDGAGDLLAVYEPFRRRARPSPRSCLPPISRPDRPPSSVAAVQVITDLDRPPWPGERTVVTIGAYDGVHLGHQAVIAARAERRRAARAPARSCSRSTATRRRSCGPSRRRSCSPTPEQRSSCSPRPASTPRWCCRFDEAQSQGVARGVHRAGAGRRASPSKVVVVGDDFHFGSHREGNVAPARASSAPTYDFDVEPVPS